MRVQEEQIKEESEHMKQNKLVKKILGAGKSAIRISAVMLVALSMIFATVSASMSPALLEATLNPGGSINEVKTVSIPELPPKADVIFAFDLTGSMGGILGTAKANAITIMNDLDGLGVDIDYGVMSYMDYPHFYNSFGYAATYGAFPPDYAYKLNQPVTSINADVSNAINGLVLGSGGDGPQDYTRFMYESYADPAVAWRPGAKRIVINFGDNIPHDNDLSEGIVPVVPAWSTGGDPGRDEIILNADDLDLQTVLAAMNANGITLLEAQTAGAFIIPYWTYWTGITGGAAFSTNSATLVNDIVAAVKAELSDPVIDGLHLQTDAGYEAWLTSVSPPSYSGPTGVDVPFEITLTVPKDAVCGQTYTFGIHAKDSSGVIYGEQRVIIQVSCEGRMTGGGSVFTKDNARVTHGFELKCDANKTPNNLEVNWGKGNKFHLETLNSAFCKDDPAIVPNPPVAGFDTYIGSGTGRYNGVSGATAQWVFTDAGEPGMNDLARLLIKDVDGNVVLVVAGNLNSGNQQAHKE
jgi:hypothetical protein